MWLMEELLFYFSNPSILIPSLKSKFGIFISPLVLKEILRHCQKSSQLGLSEFLQPSDAKAEN